MLWTSYFKHNCTSVKVHRNNEHSIGFQWRKWIQSKPCYGVKMKQCLGKFHYCSTNKTKEMGEERRKVKYIYVLQGWSSGRKFRVRIPASAPALDPGAAERSSQACGGPVHRLQRLTELAPHLAFPSLCPLGHSICRAASLLVPTSLEFKAGGNAAPPSPFALLLHTSSTDPCWVSLQVFVTYQLGMDSLKGHLLCLTHNRESQTLLHENHLPCSLIVHICGSYPWRSWYS